MIQVSIIVPTHDRFAYLRDTLQSLWTQNFPTDAYEIIVVDNASKREVSQFINDLVAKHQRTRYLHEKRIGLHFARHTGAKAARGNILVYVDDDVITSENWLSELIKQYADENVACVGGRILPQWEGQRPLWLSSLHPGYLSLLDLGDEVRQLTRPESLYGCNFSICKSVLFKVGGFNPDDFADKRLRWYRGDGETGLVDKLHAAGYRILYAPRAVVWHRIPVSRLTVAYMCSRAFAEGIRGGYSMFRKARGKPRLVLSTCVRIWLSIGYRLCKYAVTTRSDEPKVIAASVALSWSWARALYGLRFLIDSSLRQHVLRKNYLE